MRRYRLPVRAAWHRDAGRALAEAGAPADRVARQLLRALGGPGGPRDPIDGWMLNWLARTADLLVGQAPQVAVELLRRAVAGSTAGSEHHDFLVSRLADTLYRVGETAEAEQVANRALAQTVEPDLLVDLHWTLAQCRMRVGEFEESLASLEDALASPGISARHRARLLVLAARTHSNRGDFETAGEVAETALIVATEAGDNWAMGWALHVLTIVTGVQGQMTDALPLFERALTVTEADPALTDLRVLLQINQAVTLGNLDQYDEAIGAARQALYLADQAGTAIRRAQAHSALGELLFDTGRWPEALAEVEALPEDVKDAMATCCDLGIAAVIRFHRGDLAAARAQPRGRRPARRADRRPGDRLAAARPQPGPREHRRPGRGARRADGRVRRKHRGTRRDRGPAPRRGPPRHGNRRPGAAAQKLAGHAAALAAGSEIPHRQANALYCRGLLEHDTAGLLTAAERYADAGRPLLSAKALEAAAGDFLGTEDRDQARAAFIKAVEIYTSLGAATDVNRLQARFRAHGIRRGPHAKHRQARSGWDSLTPTETKVAALVVEGLSNPEIATKLLLSRRTVATHVSHILRKLGVNSRIDIAREAALRTTTPE